MADARLTGRRPISPHLQIYSPLINMVMSILHRMTGAALYFGTLLLACWLIAAASGPEEFDLVSGLFASIPGRLVLFGYTWALVHHMTGGMRHLVWDTGRAFDLPTVRLMSWASAIVSVVVTLLLWVAGYMAMGAL